MDEIRSSIRTLGKIQKEFKESGKGLDRESLEITEVKILKYYCILDRSNVSQCLPYVDKSMSIEQPPVQKYMGDDSPDMGRRGLHNYRKHADVILQ